MINIYENETVTTPEQFASDIRKYGLYDTGYFDCGQGYYQNTIQVYLKVGAEYWLFTIKAYIGSQRVDIGDDVHYFDGIESVEWIAAEKPPEPTKRFFVGVMLLNPSKEDTDKLYSVLQTYGFSETEEKFKMLDHTYCTTESYI